MASVFKVAGIGDLTEALLGDLQDGFEAGFAFELVDDRKNTPLEAFVFVINPVRYDLSEPYQAELTPAEDDTVVVEENGIIVREILLEGTFGLRERTAKGLDANLQGQGKPQSGTQHFLDLRKMWRRYSELKKSATDAAFIRMHFYSFKDDESYTVIPRTFGSPRDARQARVHRLYRLTMTAIGPAKRAGLNRTKREETFFDKVGDLSKALNDARAAFAEVNAGISLVRRRTFGNINAIMLQAAGVITAVGNFVRQLKTTAIVAPAQLGVQVATSLERVADEMDQLGTLSPQEIEAREALRRMEAAFDRIVAGSPESFRRGPDRVGVNRQYLGESRLEASDFENGTAGATLGSRTRATLGSVRDSGLVVDPVVGVREYSVTRADSVQSIANIFNTTIEIIIIINDLKFPYISEFGGPGIVKPGDKILVPVSTRTPGTETDSTSPTQYVTSEEALFGFDLALDPIILERDQRMEIKVDKAHGSDQAELVRGVKNVIQGITIILNTDLGTTVHVSDVGLRRSIGAKGTLRHTLLAAVNLQDGLISDDRINEIKEISTVLDKDVLSQEAVVELIDGRTVQVGIPFGRASGAGSTVIR